MRMNKLGN